MAGGDDFPDSLKVVSQPPATLGIVLPTQAAWAWWVKCHFAGEAKKSGAQSAAWSMGEESEERADR